MNEHLKVFMNVLLQLHGVHVVIEVRVGYVYKQVINAILTVCSRYTHLSF